MDDLRRTRPSWTRRSFLQTVGVSAPTLSLVLDRPAEKAATSGSARGDGSDES